MFFWRGCFTELDDSTQNRFPQTSKMNVEPGFNIDPMWNPGSGAVPQIVRSLAQNLHLCPPKIHSGLKSFPMDRHATIDWANGWFGQRGSSTKTILFVPWKVPGIYGTFTRQKVESSSFSSNSRFDRSRRLLLRQSRSTRPAPCEVMKSPSAYGKRAEMRKRNWPNLKHCSCGFHSQGLKIIPQQLPAP